MRLTLDYRPPLAWDALLDFLDKHALDGVEEVEAGAFRRTLQIGSRCGWFEVRPESASALRLDLDEALAPFASSVIAKVRALLDLDANPMVVDDHLGRDERLRESIERTPGIRMPGCVDGFELAWRTILGQQVTVVAAKRIAGRTALALGAPQATPFAGLTRLTPTPTAFEAASEETLGKLGWLRSRTRAVKALVSAIGRREVTLGPSADPHHLVAQLVRLPGIGPWTASYIAMRGLGWSDGWPVNDAVLVKRTGLTSPDPAWRPWSAYAALRVWYP